MSWWAVRNNDKTGEDVEFKMGVDDESWHRIRKWVDKHHEIRTFYGVGIRPAGVILFLSIQSNCQCASYDFNNFGGCICVPVTDVTGLGLSHVFFCQ